jgi:hypothetical protein
MRNVGYEDRDRECQGRDWNWSLHESDEEEDGYIDINSREVGVEKPSRYWNNWSEKEEKHELRKTQRRAFRDAPYCFQHFDWIS